MLGAYESFHLKKKETYKKNVFVYNDRPGGDSSEKDFIRLIISLVTYLISDNGSSFQICATAKIVLQTLTNDWYLLTLCKHIHSYSETLTPAAWTFLFIRGWKYCYFILRSQNIVQFYIYLVNPCNVIKNTYLKHFSIV